MLVYKKGELIREVKPISQSLFELKLTHPESKLSISTRLESSQGNTVPVSKKPNYVISKLNENGKYEIVFL